LTLTVEIAEYEESLDSETTGELPTAEQSYNIITLNKNNNKNYSCLQLMLSFLAVLLCHL
jgi:hypothetical protein